MRRRLTSLARAMIGVAVLAFLAVRMGAAPFADAIGRCEGRPWCRVGYFALRTSCPGAGAWWRAVLACRLRVPGAGARLPVPVPGRDAARWRARRPPPRSQARAPLRCRGTWAARCRLGTLPGPRCAVGSDRVAWRCSFLRREQVIPAVSRQPGRRAAWAGRPRPPARCCCTEARGSRRQGAGGVHVCPRPARDRLGGPGLADAYRPRLGRCRGRSCRDVASSLPGPAGSRCRSTGFCPWRWWSWWRPGSL